MTGATVDGAEVEAETAQGREGLLPQPGLENFVGEFLKKNGRRPARKRLCVFCSVRGQRTVVTRVSKSVSLRGGSLLMEICGASAAPPK